MIPTFRTLLPLAALALATPLAVGPVMAQGAPECGPGMGHHQPGQKGGHHGRMARLTVTGEGESRVAPDMAMVTVGVTTQAPSAAEAMSQNSTQQQTVIDALKTQGIEAKDIQTSGLNLSPLVDYQDGKAPTVTGYQAQNLVTVRVMDLPSLGTVLDSIVAAGANELQGVSFQRDDAEAATDEARTRAVAEARRRGEVLAAAAGMTLGPILSIRDVAYTNGPQPMGMMARDAKEASAMPIETGELGLNARVDIDFALLPEGGADAMPGGDCAPAGDAMPGEAEAGSDPAADPAAGGEMPQQGADDTGAATGEAPEAPETATPATEAPEGTTPEGTAPTN